MSKQNVVLDDSQVVFSTMPLGLLAIGSALDPGRHEVRIIDVRLERDPLAAVLAKPDGALSPGVIECFTCY